MLRGEQKRIEGTCFSTASFWISGLIAAVTRSATVAISFAGSSMLRSVYAGRILRLGVRKIEELIQEASDCGRRGE